MTMESDLHALLATVCPRVFPDFAATSTVRPYITFQGIGGPVFRFLDNTTGDKRRTRVQINVWADTRIESLALIRQIEDAMCAASAFTATPEGEPVHDFDADFPVYGSIQDFLITSTR